MTGTADLPQAGGVRDAGDTVALTVHLMATIAFNYGGRVESVDIAREAKPAG